LPDLIDTPDDVLISICVTKSMADKDSYDLIDTPEDVLISICVTKSMANKDSYDISVNLIDKTFISLGRMMCQYLFRL
jgi:hypothetical protein